MTRFRSRTAAFLCAALLLPALVLADHRDEPGRRAEFGHEHHDVRHGHDHYYPDRGVEVRVMPREARVLVFHGDRYWFHEGVWYRPHGPRFVVVAPPIGVYVPALPAFATLVVVGGLQYYYANDAYYRYHEDQGQYEVVAPPADAGVAAPAADGAPPGPGGSDSVFVYPKNGQPAEQQSRDRYECHRWAADQTGFDPTRVGGGVAPPAAAGKRADYLRAQQACLEARGYTVR